MFGEVSSEGYPRDRQPEWTPLDEFHGIAGKVALSVVELVIIKPRRLFFLPRSIFLLRRVGGEGGSEFDGLWHLPGGFLKGAEARRAALGRIAQKELGISLNGASIKGIGTFDNLNGDARGPLEHHVYRIDSLPSLEMEGGAYFSKFPEGLIPHQSDFLTQLASKGYLPKSLKPRTPWHTPLEQVANLSSRISHYFRS